MNLKVKIGLMQFLEFLAWGTWLVTIGAYCFNTKHWTASQFGAIFSTTGWAALFMPAVAGFIADKWINAERMYGFAHLACAVCMACVPLMQTPAELFWLMLLNMCFYMPTVSMTFSLSYAVMENAGMDILKEYPPLRAFGTIGFAAGMWSTSLLGLESSPWQFYISSACSLCLGLFAFTLPKCPPAKSNQDKSWLEVLGFDAIKLFKSANIAIFFMFSILIGVCLQLSSAYFDGYLHDFAKIPQYAASPVLKYPAIVISLGQLSEAAFVLMVPFLLKRIGIRNIMVFSIFAWVTCWLLLAYGNPSNGLALIIAAMLIRGMAFDFFNLSGSLYIEKTAPVAMRSSAQGLYQVMVIGVAAIIGSYTSGWLIDTFFTTNGVKDWHGIMLAFAGYSIFVAIAFILLFKDNNTRTVSN